MRKYDSSKLLVSIHVPKCAGTSLTTWLEGMFPGQLHLHYPDDAPPERYDQSARSCVHGHFYHHEWPIGALDYYPQADQFITVLRDPLQMMISSYFYQCKMGDPPFAELESYLDHVTHWHRLFPYLGLPLSYTEELDIREVEDKFVWLGVVEELERSLSNISSQLNITPRIEIPHSNQSPRESSDCNVEYWGQVFRDRFRWEYQLYDFAYNLNCLKEEH